MTKSYKLAESITSFRQDKTLADIVQKVDDEAFQDYPFLKALVDKSNYLNQNNWQQNMEFITDMLPLFGKLSTLECFVGLPHYFADTYQAIKNWQANKPKPIRVPWFNPPQQHADKVQKLYNVTFDLETSIKNCRIFGNAISEGRGLYAFIGPKIEKWKRDEYGKLILQNNAPVLNLNDQIKVLSALCAPWSTIEDGKTITYDLRFISDSEALVKEGKTVVYGLNRAELEKIRTKLKPGDDEAVFYITARPENAQVTAQLLAGQYNNILINGSGFVNQTIDLLQENTTINYKQLAGILRYLSQQTHDKIPHSLIGSFIKNFGTELLIQAVEQIEEAQRGALNVKALRSWPGGNPDTLKEALDYSKGIISAAREYASKNPEIMANVAAAKLEGKNHYLIQARLEN